MFVAVDEDRNEYIYAQRPIRGDVQWIANNSSYIRVPKGTIQRLLNHPLTWDDDCQEIVEYKDKDLKEDKVIKQNIKIRVTPEQSKKVQEICFENGICWRYYSKVIQTESIFLYIDGALAHDLSNDEQYFKKDNFQEVDADLFIRTNGTCEEESTLNDDTQRNIIFAPNADEHLRKKIVNLHDQLNKNRKTVQNQKEELTRLLNQKKQLNNRLDIYALCTGNQKIKITNLLAQKEDLQNQLNMANRTVKELIDNGDDLVKYLEKKDILIKYLENKLAKKTNEAYEKKVMSFEELYIKQADEYYKKVEDKVMGKKI